MDQNLLEIGKEEALWLLC